MNNSWLINNTFHYSDFTDIQRLIDIKKKKNLTISLCLPTLNEEKTIAKEIIIMKSELMTRNPLLDEIVIIDSGSTDNTVEVAKAFQRATSSFIWMRILKIFTTGLLTGSLAPCCWMTLSNMQRLSMTDRLPSVKTKCGPPAAAG
jgi:cellulose synthase/poly-beta-1,6-N-acetylglucosamine synthase-like glycosyltransferase